MSTVRAEVPPGFGEVLSVLSYYSEDGDKIGAGRGHSNHHTLYQQSSFQKIQDKLMPVELFHEVIK